MQKISAVINTRNEENNVRYCLDTLKWCDEIIVVDMESEDRTVDIVREYTDKVFNFEKAGYMEPAREFAVEKAAGEWILLVDADEMVTKSLSEALLKITERNDVDVVEVPFKHYIMGDWVQNSGWGYSPMPRFFRKGSMNFTNTIHGYMDVSPDARVIQLVPTEQNCIIHFNYRDSTHFIEKLNRYTSVEAGHLYERGQNFRYGRMFLAALREFHGRYVKGKGYRDGVRGFALSTLMAFYRILTYIKLWEMREFHDDSVDNRYDRLRCKVVEEWK